MAAPHAMSPELADAPRKTCLPAFNSHKDVFKGSRRKKVEDQLHATDYAEEV
jgi:hypothetical protein